MADRAKGLFISNISHELRSPLHGILASAEFLSDTQVDPLQQTFIDTIDSCGRTLLDVINHVLDFGKLMYTTRKNKLARPPILRESQENIPQSLGAEATDLLGITEQIVESCHAGYEFEGLFGHADIGSIFGDPSPRTNTEPQQHNGYGEGKDPTSELTVVIDIEYRKEGWLFVLESGAVQRIIMNITGNALKYTSSGWVRVHLFTQQSKARRTVHITVTDSGKGISPQFLRSQLFSPFAQEDALQAGTGLGMSIVRQAVERLGGEIKVSSKVDVGTQVHVILPGKVVEPPGALDVGTRVRSRTNGKKVFLADFNREVPASRLLYESLVAYLTNWFCMQVVEEMEKSDLIVSDECPVLLDSFQRNAQTGQSAVFSNQIHALSARPSAPENASQNVFSSRQPLIVLCSNALRYEFYGQQPTRGSKIIDFATKPCGPSKLARSLLFCLDKSETA
jgi:signal transduction histidine kinase